MTDVKLKQINRVLLYIFVFSIAFERAFPFLTGLSFPKAVSIIYFISLCMNQDYLRLLLRGKVNSVVLALFGTFLITNIFNAGLFSSETMKSLNVSFVLNTLLIWVLLHHEKLDPGVLERTIIFFSIGYLLLVLAYYLGFYQTGTTGRVFIGNALPNNLGINGVIAICGLLIFANNTNVISVLRGSFILLAALLTLTLVLATGSRSAALSLVVVILIYLVHSRKSVQLLSLTAAIVLFPLAIETFNVLADRAFSTIENVELGGRIAIYLFVFNIISSNYIFGVGRSGYDALAELQFGFSPSPHNVFLEVFLYGGIWAGILWLFVIYKTCSVAFSKYKILGQLSGLLLLPPLLMNALSGQIFNNSLIFLLIAIIIADETKVLKTEA
jgi:O-antigen ligase